MISYGKKHKNHKFCKKHKLKCDCETYGVGDYVISLKHNIWYLFGVVTFFKALYDLRLLYKRIIPKHLRSSNLDDFVIREDPADNIQYHVIDVKLNDTPI